MKRWGLLGLLALSACTTSDPNGGVNETRDCPEVTSGRLTSQEMAQSVWTSEGPRRPAEDGRESVLIRMRPGRVSASAARVERAGGQVQHTFESVPALAARLSARERAALAADPDVEAIEPDVEWHALGTQVPRASNAPQATGSAGEYTEGVRLVQASRVWDANGDGLLDSGAPNGDGIKVCVIDSGIDPNHPELKSRIIAGRDFVDGDDDPTDREGDVWGEGHGTHVAGTIAAQLGSGAVTDPSMDSGGVTGVAPGVQLLIARVLNLEGRAKLSHVLSALEWCHQQGAHVASLSLGGGEWGETARQLFQSVYDNGMLVVAAAGNDGGPLLYPAAFPSVLAVGAVDTREKVADFSCQGDNLSLVAPGVDVLSTFVQGRGSFAELEVAGAHHASRSFVFAPAGDVSGELVDCGYGSSRSSCRGGTCGGFVAYVELGGGRVETVLSNVMRQGARAVVMGNALPGGQPETVVLGPGRWVPGTMVGYDDAEAVRGKLGGTARVQVRGMDYARFSGTSMAAPHVTGVAALVWSARPSLSPTQVRALLEKSAKDLGDKGFDTAYGNGLVQAQGALDALRLLP
ncbi:S8 family serine peptidase [Myxococcaceae bacterium GXIMD 01537]